MAKKRPCKICRRWFHPHPRAGARQRTCSSEDCQRERHRRACANWRGQHPDYDREERLRQRLVPVEKTDAGRPIGEVIDPLAVVDWAASRNVVGLGASLLIEESGQLLVRWTRDVVQRQVQSIQGDTGRLPQNTPRDAVPP